MTWGHRREYGAQDRAAELRRQEDPAEIANLYNAEGHRTATGAEYKPTTVYRMVNRVDPGANPEGGHRGKAIAAA